MSLVGNHMSRFIYTAFLKACLIHICMAINFKDKVQTVNMITESNLLKLNYESGSFSEVEFVMAESIIASGVLSSSSGPVS